MTIEAACPNKNEGQALEGLSSSYSNGCIASVTAPVVHCQPDSNLPRSYNVKYGDDHVLGDAVQQQMGAAQVKIKVSWEEVEAVKGLHPHGELWVRVLSDSQLDPTTTLPKEVSEMVSAEVLGRYYATGCDWQPDLREDDDETIPEWPYEQWWALPKMRTSV